MVWTNDIEIGFPCPLDMYGYRLWGGGMIKPCLADDDSCLRLDAT
jgi:hypothetical protein